MRNFIKQCDLAIKSRITPVKRDIATLLLGAIFFGILYTLWPLAVLFVATFGIGTAISYSLFSYLIVGKHLRSMNTEVASRRLLQEVKNNTLTLTEAKWLLLPGIFRDKCDLKGGDDLPRIETALHYASRYGRLDLIELFYFYNNAKDDLNFKMENALHIAAKRNHERVIMYILEHDFGKLGQKNKDTLTPVHLAAQHGSIDAFKIFMRQNAIDTYSINNKMTLFGLAIYNSHDQILKIYQEEFNNDKNILDLTVGPVCYVEHFFNIVTFYPNENLLHIAARNGNLPSLTYLLKIANSTHLNQCAGEQRLTPIQVAYLHQNNECVTLFEQYGCRIENKEELDTLRRDEQQTLLYQYRDNPQNKNVNLSQATPNVIKSVNLSPTL